MSRSLRHPFKGPRHYLRPERERRTRSKRPRQPKMRQSRFSVEAMLDAPDSSESRPGIRLRIIALVVVALFALLGLRLWTLQVLQAPAAAQAVAANEVQAVQIEPNRGLILDREGNPLVNNVVTEQITLSRVAATQYPQVVGRLAALIGESAAQVDATINDRQYSQYKPVPILSEAPLQDIQYIKEHQSEFPGVASVATTQRNYPQVEPPGPAANGYPAAQVLGYVGTINSTELKSRASSGYQAGDDVVTNIDTGLQEVADNALATQILALRKTFDPQCANAQGVQVGCDPAATGGAVVVMSPQTGAVYAMSSYPSYNPEVWVGGISTSAYNQLSNAANNEPLINRAIDGLYTPGSTFKLSTATAALNLGLIGPNTDYNDTGTFMVPGCQYSSTSCTLHNSEGDGGFGDINVSTALTVSSDDFFYNLGAMFWDDRGNPAYGDTPIQNQAAQYGLGELTGIDLPGESNQARVDSQAERQKLHAESPTGFPNTTWYTGDNVEMAFGQGATVITPIEQAVAYSTFANGGTRYAPQVAAAIVSSTGKVIKRFTPQVTGHVSLPPTTYQALLAGFTGVVQQGGRYAGTAYTAFQGLNFPGGIAGKTGTADSEVGKEPTGWFVGFGPTADPQYVVVCVIDQAGYGATAAAPVVRSIFNYLATNPVGPATIPPAQATVQSNTPLTPPTTPTTTTTTTPGTRATTTTTTAQAG